MMDVLFEREWLGHVSEVVIDVGRREGVNQSI